MGYQGYRPQGQPRCARCGRFVDCRTEHANYTPDSPFTVERFEWVCRACWDFYQTPANGEP